MSKTSTTEPGSADFKRGYVCAVANLVNMHSDHVAARDMLGCIGTVDWLRIDALDRQTLSAAGLIEFWCPNDVVGDRVCAQCYGKPGGCFMRPERTHD